MPSVRAMSAMRAADTVARRANDAPPPTPEDRDHADGEDRQHERVGRDPHAQPESPEQRTRDEEQERDAHDVHDGGVARRDTRRGPPRRGTAPSRGRRPGSRRAGCPARTGPGRRGSGRRTGSPTAAGARCRQAGHRRSATLPGRGPAARRSWAGYRRPSPTRARRTRPGRCAVASSRSSVRPSHAHQLARRAAPEHGADGEAGA